ncbi:hypothetical protein [Photorhabdus australis]|uniref:hypothetical protein n=1 Tax=Photorhabdus australis TaxID=286156 RepID=UPI0012FEE121|nr:hypothetical protein [Photorhabdus australis]
MFCQISVSMRITPNLIADSSYLVHLSIVLGRSGWGVINFQLTYVRLFQGYLEMSVVGRAGM